MKCPECTLELELTRPTFYRCIHCQWLGQIMSAGELERAINIAQKYANDPERITHEMEREFSHGTGV